MSIKSAILICVLSIGTYYVKYHLLTSDVIIENDQAGQENDSSESDVEKPQLFSKEEVAQYVTEDKLYLCILGHVFDVTKGMFFFLHEIFHFTR